MVVENWINPFRILCEKHIHYLRVVVQNYLSRIFFQQQRNRNHHTQIVQHYRKPCGEKSINFCAFFSHLAMAK